MPQFIKDLVSAARASTAQGGSQMPYYPFYPSLKELQELDPAYFGLSEIWKDLSDGGMGAPVEYAGD